MTHQTVGYAPGTPLRACDGPEVEPDPACPIEITLAALRGRWTVLVIAEFIKGDRCYADVAAALPALSDKVLSERLAQLTAAGVLQRSRTQGWPPRVEYGLTEHGRAIIPVLRALWDWGVRQQAS